MSKHIDRIVRDAIAAGVLSPATAAQPEDERPWSVVLLSAVAAWFSAIPLAVVAFLSLPEPLSHGYGMFALGAIILAVSVVLSRADSVSLFVGQLGLPGLLIGGTLMGAGLSAGGNSDSLAAALLVPVAILVAFLVRRSWQQTLLGLAVGSLVAFSISTLPALRHGWDWKNWLAWNVVAVVWLGIHTALRSTRIDGRSAARIAVLESVSTGIAVAALGGLLIFSGTTFLLDTVLPRWLRSVMLSQPYYPALSYQLSAVSSIGAAVWLALRWPALRTWWFLGVGAILALLGWFIPSLGTVLLVMVACVSSGRPALASFAAGCAIWMVGGLYYQLEWPLVAKAALLGVLGAALIAIARYFIPGERTTEMAPVGVPSPARTSGSGTKSRWAIVMCGAAVLVVANAGIWQKEAIISKGSPVFIELAPVDPRSLVQGDFMRLRFAMADLPDSDRFSYNPTEHPQAVLRSDARGIATLVRLYEGGPLNRGEFLINLALKNNELTFVTDAWYFKEGEGARWSKARYGEFRVAPDGSALLVGLRGPNLEKL